MSDRGRPRGKHDRPPAAVRPGRLLGTEHVVGDEEANRILAGKERSYREPFVMPAAV
jgi:hypothetical protein